METASGDSDWKRRLETANGKSEALGTAPLLHSVFPFGLSIRSFHSLIPIAVSTRRFHSHFPDPAATNNVTLTYIFA
jgi:hypothetical protein